MDMPEVSRLIDAEKRDARSERRFVGGVTGVFFGLMSGLLLVVGVSSFVRDLASAPLDITDQISILIFCVLTVLPFAVAHWCFKTTGSRSLWQVLSIGGLISLALTGTILTSFTVMVLIA